MLLLRNIKLKVYKKAIFFAYKTLYKYKREIKKREKTKFTTTLPPIPKEDKKKLSSLKKELFYCEKIGA